jgi:predicted aspartyl protease
MSIADCLEFSRALLGMEGELILVKDGKRLGGSTLDQAGVQNGDLLVVMKPQAQAPAPAAASAARPPAAAGGLDFSSLLGSAGSSSNAAPSGGGLDFSSLLASAGGASSSTGEPPLVYYPGMTLADMVDHNPHPRAVVKLLQQHPNLSKELNYHNPTLARKLQNQPYEAAVEIWRNDMVKGSIQTASAITQSFHKEQLYQKRIQENPNDTEAKEYFDRKRKKGLVQQQYQQAMQEYPESMGRVLMLYVEAKINNHTLQAFVDSGAQATIMSKKCALKCGILDYVDTRFAGVAVGVGTGKILGRIHIVQLQIGNTYFPCSVTVMDDMTLPSGGPTAAGKDGDAPKPKDMDFLLGLDMLKRHLCVLDLGQGCLKFRLAPGQYMETPFLHEKDLDESKGGTKGFNAERSNQELEDAQRRYEEEQKKSGGDSMED